MAPESRTNLEVAPLSLSSPDPGRRSHTWNVVFWWSCVLSGPPVALATARVGFGVAVDRPLRDLALLCLWALVEEIIFRGALQPALARAFADRASPLPWLTASNVATSIVFAAAHLWRHPPFMALAVFPVSLLFGIARERSGRIGPPVLLHVYFNVLLYAASWLM